MTRESLHNIIWIAVCGLILLFAVPAISGAVTADRIDHQDDFIAQRLNDKVRPYPNVSVDVRAGTAIVDGMVCSQDDKAQVMRKIANTSGVLYIIDHLKVAPNREPSLSYIPSQGNMGEIDT